MMKARSWLLAVHSECNTVAPAVAPTAVVAGEPLLALGEHAGWLLAARCVRPAALPLLA